MFPTKLVPVPSVAELPTCQNTLQLVPGLISTTAELLAVVRVLPILKMKSAFGLPSPSRTSVPVNCADEEKQYTPGVSVRPPRSWPVKSTLHGVPAMALYAVVRSL